MRRIRTTALTLCLVSAARSLRLVQGVHFPPAHVVIVGTSVAVVALGFVKPRLQRSQVLYTPEPGSLTGQVILITGATSGLGLESAKRLAVSGAKVVLTSRSHEKGKAALDDVATYLRNQGIKNENVSYKVLQLDDLNSIRSAVEAWGDIDRVDVLMLNAGVMACREREITTDGFERQIQSNHLGHFLLTALLSPRLTPNARIIAVSSAAYKLSLMSGMDFDYIWEAEKYSPWKSYSQSKLANILFVQVRFLQRSIGNGRHKPRTRILTLIA
jgi:short chain dehydrogenase